MVIRLIYLCFIFSLIHVYDLNQCIYFLQPGLKICWKTSLRINKHLFVSGRSNQRVYFFGAKYGGDGVCME